MTLKLARFVRCEESIVSPVYGANLSNHVLPRFFSLIDVCMQVGLFEYSIFLTYIFVLKGTLNSQPTVCKYRVDENHWQVVYAFGQATVSLEGEMVESRDSRQDKK